MLTAAEYITTKHRLCAAGVGCNHCPINSKKLEVPTSCGGWVATHPDEAVAIVEQWGREHPVKTILTDLLEKYPNIKMGVDGLPGFCPYELGLESTKGCVGDDEVECEMCWNKPLEEVNK